MSATERIRVQTPCRLHLGIFSLPEGGYGGIGVAIDQPSVDLTVTRADRLTAVGPQADRALQVARALQQAYGVSEGAAIQVAAAITPHVGLGSGTQLALATAATLARLWGLNPSTEEIAGIAGRGARSRVGLQVFVRGGFVAHATWQCGETATRHRRFPAEWRWLVAAPPECEGLSGEAEAKAFGELPPMTRSVQREARDLVELEILPAVEAGEIARFGQGLMGLQALVGDYFAPVQGGRYAHPLGQPLAEALVDLGAAGVAQSSWGPSICGIFAGQPQAEQALHSLLRRFDGTGLRAWVATPDNLGTRWEQA